MNAQVNRTPAQAVLPSNQPLKTQQERQAIMAKIKQDAQVRRQKMQRLETDRTAFTHRQLPVNATEPVVNTAQPVPVKQAETQPVRVIHQAPVPVKNR
ncbi:hypothetical protein FPE01S_02_07160 [Flavihumibacter petaseus NBRC 106054]|uniref:Uncharacterized protein n=1 Tax=Flavihumibacter petaseus NBRC 106054 TaxID=1220578 RepID=A0A0E9N2Q1_9BACT|nr:hypothetical protein FPE01S_02_07160 [Flavihumibacter petaseus NBRC 106054]